MLKAIKKTRIHEEVVTQVHDLIKEGKFKAGDQLPSERELAETFKVSRTSVREALRALDRGAWEAFARTGARISATAFEVAGSGSFCRLTGGRRPPNTLATAGYCLSILRIAGVRQASDPLTTLLNWPFWALTSRIVPDPRQPPSKPPQPRTAPPSALPPKYRDRSTASVQVFLD